VRCTQPILARFWRSSHKLTHRSPMSYHVAMAATDILSIRFEKGTKARLEKIRVALVKQTGVKIPRAAVIKMLVEEGCKVVEARIAR